MSATKPPPGHFTILYFAAAASYTSKSFDHIAAPLPVTELFKTLEQKYPGMKAKVLESCAVTINLDYVDVEDESDKTIQTGDEVAIIPPVSSG